MIQQVEEKIKTIIDNSTPSYKQDDIICKLTEIILYQNTNDTDIITLKNTIGFDNMLKVFKIFSGKKKQFIDYDKIHDSLIFAFIYYYKELYIDIDKGKKGLQWKEIETKLNINLDKYKTRYLTIKNNIIDMTNEFLNEDIK